MRVTIIKGKRIHALDNGKRLIKAAVNQHLQKHFSVACCSKCDVLPLQLGPQLFEIVYLAVVGKGISPLVVPEGLPASFGQIQQRQAGVNQPDARVAESALLIQAAVMKQLPGLFELVRRYNRGAIRLVDAEESAHGFKRQ